VKDINDMAL